MKKRLVIGVTGPSAGGKSTVTRKILEEFDNDIAVLNYDDYYNDQSHLTMEERYVVNYDHPNAFDTKLLLDDLKKLIAGETIHKPVYDFTEHNRKAEYEELHSKNIIIIEGLFTLLDEEIRELLDVKIYVDTDPDECFIRRLIRDTRDRGRTQESVINQYLQTVKPMQEQFISPTKKFADFVVLKGGKNPIIINIITEFIKKNL